VYIYIKKVHFILSPCPGTIKSSFYPLYLPKGLAFLPAVSSSLQQQSLEINPNDFEWRKVTVEKHNEMANKWRIKEYTSGTIYEVPRIYLMFIVEKPFMFAKRIHEAIQLRWKYEGRLKFEAAVDKIVLWDFPHPPQRLQDNIRKLLDSFRKPWIEFFEEEHTKLYQKTLAAIDLIKFVEKHPRSFPSTIQLPAMERRQQRKLKNLVQNNGKTSFEKSRNDFQQMWLYCCPEAIKIMEFINNECSNIGGLSLFHIETNVARSLTEFVDENSKKTSTISNFLKQWIEEDIVGEVKRQLTEMKGWFNLNVNDWSIYRMSKLKRLIGWINHRIEIGVRLMLRSSLRAFVNHLCQACEAMLNLSEDFIWGNDLVNSHFNSPNPVFSLELNFSIGNEPTFVGEKNLEDFEMEIIEMFKSKILTTHKLPQIEPYIITKLKFDKDLLLSSIGILDEDIQGPIQRLRQCFCSCLIPLRAYAREFKKFLQIETLNVFEHVASFRESSSEEIVKEIYQQLKSIEDLDASLPTTIVIGPFQISVESVKKNLIVKCRQLHERFKLLLVENLEEKLEAIYKEFKEKISKLTHKCESVEELVKIREWIPQIPSEMAEIEMRMTKLFNDFNFLDSLLITVSDNVLSLKIQSQMMPKEIHQKISDAHKNLEFDFEVFRKRHITQVNQFEQETLDRFIYDVDLHFAAPRESADVSKVANEVDVLWRHLNEIKVQCEHLNDRQKIFNHPEIDMEQLTVIFKRLHPHYKLWTTASNFLQSMKSLLFAPLSSVDVQIIEAEKMRWKNVVEDCRHGFVDDAEVTVVIELILTSIEKDLKDFEVLSCLKKSAFKDHHWSILIERTGLPIKFTPETTLDSLLRHGISKYMDVLNEILLEATSEEEARNLEELKAERKRQQEEEIMKQKKARRAERNKIYNI
jgi:dynein heavy chain, axonemal